MVNFKTLKRILCWILVVIGVLIFFGFLLVILSPFIMLANEAVFLAEQLDNPHIDDNYSNWVPAGVSEENDFLIPPEWHLDNSSGVYQILNDENECIGYGTLCGPEQSDNNSLEELLSSISNDKITAIYYDHIPGFIAIDYCDCGKLRVDSIIQGNTYYYYIKLADNDSSFFFVFLPSYVAEEKVFLEIAQAIVFSFTLYEM